jgi:glycine cleavage system H protein
MLLSIICRHIRNNFSKNKNLSKNLSTNINKKAFSTFYTKNHEWIKIEDNKGTIGITNYAQEELGDIVFADFEDNIKVDRGEVIGNVESVKAASDIFAPVDCHVIEVNTKLEETPDLINQKPESDGWIVKVEILNDDRDELLNKEEYDDLINK